MGMSITYKNQEINFDVGTEEWYTPDRQIINTSLSKVKAAIDKIANAHRKVSVDALMVEDSYWNAHRKPKIIEVAVTIICEAKHGRLPEYCWVTEGEGKKANRSKVRITNLYPLSARPALEKWLELSVAARQAEKEASKYLDTIERFDDVSLQAAGAVTV